MPPTSTRHGRRDARPIADRRDPVLATAPPRVPLRSLLSAARGRALAVGRRFSEGDQDHGEGNRAGFRVLAPDRAGAAQRRRILILPLPQPGRRGCPVGRATPMSDRVRGWDSGLESKISRATDSYPSSPGGSPQVIDEAFCRPARALKTVPRVAAAKTRSIPRRDRLRSKNRQGHQSAHHPGLTSFPTGSGGGGDAPGRCRVANVRCFGTVAGIESVRLNVNTAV